MPPQQMAPALPTTSEKKKKLWISCLNFAKTRVKNYVKMLRNILTRNNSNKKIKDTSFAKAIIFKTDIKAKMSIHQNWQSNQIWLNFFKYFCQIIHLSFGFRFVFLFPVAPASVSVICTLMLCGNRSSADSSLMLLLLHCSLMQCNAIYSTLLPHELHCTVQCSIALCSVACIALLT